MADVSKALEFAVGLNQQINDRNVVEIEGRPYCFRNPHPVEVPQFPRVSLSTLTGLRDYLDANRDGLELNDVMVRVAGPDEVVVMSPLFGPHRQRDTILAAQADLPRFPLNNHVSSEDFIIGVNAMFLDAGDKEALLSDVAKIKVGDETTIVDDGVSQTVSIATGARLLTKKTLASRVTLYPWCTFQEVEQPAREFVFRLDREGKPGLFEADGNAWKNTAMLTVREWLKHNLPEQIAILA